MLIASLSIARLRARDAEAIRVINSSAVIIAVHGKEMVCLIQFDSAVYGLLDRI